MPTIFTPLEKELAALIVDALKLEEVEPEAIDPNAPLFNEGLALDSIDALELSLAIAMKYGFEIKSNDPDNERIFSNLKSLARHIEARRSK